MYSCSRIVRSARVDKPIVVVVDEAKERRARASESVASSSGAHAAVTLIAEARADAQRILAAAHAEAAHLRQVARDQALQEARAIARQEAEAALSARWATVEALAAGIAAERERILATAERDLVALALAVAGKVVHEQASVDPSLVQSTVNLALSRIGAQGDVRVRVNPADLESVAPLIAARSPGDGSRQCEVVADEAISRGGCLVEVGSGTVDARVESQLAEAVRFFESLLAGG